MRTPRTIALFAIVTVFLLSACSSDPQKVEADAEMASSEQMGQTSSLDKSDESAKIAYAMGANSGNFLARNLPEFGNWGMTFDPALIKKGFLESLDNKSQMDEQEIQTVLMAFQEQIKTKLAEIEQQKSQASAEANTLFLDENAAKDDVKVTASGMHYRIIKAGEGKTPTATDTVRAHYRGSLINGQEFDSSYSRNEPSEFSLDAVIPGWTEGLQLIKEGGKIELVLPPELAYGERILPQIPANSVLIFEVELIAIVNATKTDSETSK